MKTHNITITTKFKVKCTSKEAEAYLETAQDYVKEYLEGALDTPCEVAGMLGVVKDAE